MTEDSPAKDSPANPPAAARRCRVITLSAPFGTGGSVIGPAVARRLGMEFVDRAITVEVANELAVSLETALAHDEKVSSVFGRMLAAAARLPALAGGVVLPGVETPLDDETFQEATDEVIRHIAETTGGVLLGRGAAIVLADRTDCLHVRLTGQAERRVRRAQELLGLSEEEARRQQRVTDRARNEYMLHFFKRRLDSVDDFHLVLDSTVEPIETCIELICQAADAFAPV